MSTDLDEELPSVLVDDSVERSVVLPLVVGAVCLTLLLAAQVGLAAARVERTSTALPITEAVATASPDPTAAPAPTAASEPTAAAEPTAALASTAAPQPTAVSEPTTAPVPTTAPQPTAAPESSVMPEAAPVEEPAPADGLTDPRAVALQEALDAAGDVTFDPVTGEPSESRTAVLNAVAAAVLEAGDLPIAVVGHAEPSDSPGVEQSIGLQRAQAVELSLRLRMVPRELLVTESAGAGEVADADAGAGNRRVSFRVLPPG